MKLNQIVAVIYGACSFINIVQPLSDGALQIAMLNRRRKDLKKSGRLSGTCWAKIPWSALTLIFFYSGLPFFIFPHHPQPRYAGRFSLLMVKYEIFATKMLCWCRIDNRCNLLFNLLPNVQFLSHSNATSARMSFRRKKTLGKSWIHATCNWTK